MKTGHFATSPPTPTDAARAWHADELAPAPGRKPPRMAQIQPEQRIVDARTGRDVAEPADDWQPTGAPQITIEGDHNGKRLTVELKFTDEPDSQASERRTDAIRDHLGPAILAALRNLAGPDPADEIKPGAVQRFNEASARLEREQPLPGVSLTDIYGDSPGVRAASDRMAGTHIPLDSDDDGEPD